MSTAVSRRRGTTAEHATFTGIESEITVDTDVYTLVVHDGVTAGGYRLRRDYVDTTNVLLGRSSASSGAIENITIGSGLVLTGGVLHATGGSSFGGADASYLTLGTHASLSNERVFTPGNGLQATDNGANGTYAISVKTSDFLGSYALSGDFIRTGDILPGTGVSILNSGQYTYINVNTSSFLGQYALTSNVPSIAATYLTLSNDSTLSNERVLTMGNGIQSTDAGANSTYTISVKTADFLGTYALTSNVPSNAATYLTLSTDATLSNERTFTVATGIEAIDGGAGNPYTITIKTSDFLGSYALTSFVTSNYIAYNGNNNSGTLIIGTGNGFDSLSVGTNDQILAVTGNTIAYKTPYNSFSWWVTFHNRPLSVAATGGTLTYAAADVSLANQTDADGWVGGRSCADSNITWLGYQFPCPDELDTTQSVNASVYYRIGAAGANQVELKTVTRVVDRDQSLNSGGTYSEATGTTSLAGYATDDLAITNINNVLTGGMFNGTSREWVKGTLIRDATAGNAADTFAGTIIVMGIKFSGTRKKWS